MPKFESGLKTNFHTCGQTVYTLKAISQGTRLFVISLLAKEEEMIENQMVENLYIKGIAFTSSHRHASKQHSELP